MQLYAKRLLIALYDAAADHIGSFIKNSALPGGHPLYILIKTYNNAIFVCMQVRKGAFILIPDLGKGFHSFCNALVFYPVQAFYLHFAAVQVFFLTKHNGIGFG